MSADYQGQDPIDIAKQAEKDLHSHAAIHGHDAGISARHANGASTSTTESGVDDTVTNKFPGSTVTYGSAASGQGNNREIPLSEGGSIDPSTGKPFKAGAFTAGVGAPERAAEGYAERHGGDDAVRGNVRQGQGQTGKP